MKQNIFQVMVEMQHSLNKQTAGEDYLEKNLNWNSAIIAESGELLDSLGYKWWKKQESDMENVKVEAIDLLHFVISEVIQEKGISKCISFLKYWFADDYLYLLKEYEDNTIEQLISLLISSSDARLLYLKMIFRKLEMSNEDVYIAYITKNCLNKFRQNNGYKDGTYIKNWKGKEDNIIAFSLANIIGPKENLFDELYETLSAYYNKEVLNNKKEVHISSILDDLPDPFKCYKKI